jgi:PTH1 family peptidyl-tRNA hydrolase
MRLIAGLGNPGDKYAQNRHNVGFMAVDRLREAGGLSPWRSRFQGLVAEGTLGGEKVLLLKPQTFMNDSGRSVGEAMRFLKIPVADLTVILDEIDLAPGRLRAKTGGGHAGHNGLRSIHAHVGDAYHRIRIGVGHPGHKDAVPGYVLRDFPKADQGWLDDLLRGIEDGADALARQDFPGFQNRVALRLSPPRPSKPAPEAVRAPEPDRPAAESTLSADPRSALQRLADRFR